MRVVLAALGLTLALAPAAHASGFAPWRDPIAVTEVNTSSQDGCPIESPDGLSLYLASTRPRFAGDMRTDLDIWVAHRASTHSPWGAPENLGAPVNSTDDDFCPTPIPGGGLFFVSRKTTPGVTCGIGDIYFTHRHRRHGWRAPQHLACDSSGGPNTALDEQGPSYVTAGGPQLYFSSGPDIYVSRQRHDGSFGPATAVSELNSPMADVQPNLRKDGLEVVFASTRTGSAGFDLYAATRPHVTASWSAPVNLGEVNTPDNETRPSLSRDATRMYFGRAPAAGGPADVYVTTRTRHPRRCPW